MRIHLLTILTACALPNFAHASDQCVNDVYGRMRAAYASLDPAQLETVYAPDATYLPRSAKASVNTRETIRRGQTGFIDQVRARNGNIKISFRVSGRKRFDDVYIDHGYVRTVIEYGDGTPSIISNGKFLAAIARQSDGHWAFISDSDSETPPVSFDTAKPVSGLRYDD